MKIDSPDFHALFTPGLKLLWGLFEKNGYELRICGGAVRDLLMGKPPADIDLATNATPENMVDLFTRSEIIMLPTNVEKNGTVTCRIGKTNFEVTTLRGIRIDKVCDGRKAEVEFTNDWEWDANRRDLTINSLFLNLDGTVVDYTGGVEDCEKRRVAFVGVAAHRIQEEYLTILRYFRFFGRIAHEGAVHEEETIRAIVENREGLAVICRERIWAEMKRIVIGRLAPQVVKVMLDECGLTKLLGLPDSSLSHMDRYTRVYHRGMEMEKKHAGAKLESMTMVAALCTEKKDIDEFHAKTKLSSVERKLGRFIVERREEAEEAVREGSSSPLIYWRRLFAREYGPMVEGKVGWRDCDRIRDIVMQLAITVAAPEEVLTDLLSSPHPPIFPVDGLALMGAKVPKSRISFVNYYLFDLWIQSDFTLSKEELLTHTEDSAIPSPPPKEKKG